MRGGNVRASTSAKRFGRGRFAAVGLAAGIWAVGVLGSGIAASAAPIRDPDAASETARMTLIQFPKLSFSPASDIDRNWTGSPLLAINEEESALEAVARDRARGSLADNSATTTGATADPTNPTGALSVSAASGAVGGTSAGQDRSNGSSVPEPASIVMIGLASLALYFFGRRWSKQHEAG